MKNLIKYLVSLLVLLMAAPVILWAQDSGGSSGVDVQTYFFTLSGFVAAVMAITQFIKKAITGISGFWARLLSWAVAIILALAGWFLQYGIFAGLQWYWALLYALAAGLIGNGIFDIGIINALLSLVPKKSK